MIFKAIVVSRTDDDNKIYVTIPILDGASSKVNFKGVNKRLATICTVPGCVPVYAPGDVVYVDFEQDDMSIPIVLGSLLSSDSSSILNVTAESLSVNVNAQFSEDTFIGDSQINNLPSGSDSSGTASGQPVIETLGILKGEGRGVITSAEVDDLPSPESTNLVTSGGVVSAIDTAINNKITYGTEDLQPGISLLPEGVVYLVYE